jgi:Tfp pilus assembly protein PilF
MTKKNIFKSVDDSSTDSFAQPSNAKKLNIFKKNVKHTPSEPADAPPEKSNIFKSSGSAEKTLPSATEASSGTNIFKASEAKPPRSQQAQTRTKNQTRKIKTADSPSPKDSSTDQLDQPSVYTSVITNSKRDKFSTKLAIGLSTLVGIFLGGYFLFTSESPTDQSASSKNETSKPQIEPKSLPTPSALSTASTQSLSISSLKSYLHAMLQAAHDQNLENVEAASNALSAISSPTPGDKRTARTYNDEGLVALKLQDYPLAIKSFRIGASEDPSNIELVNNLGFALYKNGQLSEAKEQIELALLYSPKRSAAWVNLADILFKEGNEDKAIDAYLLAYAFAKSKDRTLKMVESIAENDPDSRARFFYSQVRAALIQSRL